MDTTFDSLYYEEGKLLAGVDETGLCDMAGPLVAACVVLPKIDLKKDDLRIFDIRDSKTLPEYRRKKYAEIIWQTAYAIGIGVTSPQEIDYLGVGPAARLAMLRSVEACKRTTTKRRVVPDMLLIDGAGSWSTSIPFKFIKSGDNKSLSIASASIIAKVYRDEEMVKLHEKHPHYGWNSNKGHPTQEQFKAIDKHGIVMGVHRLSLWPISSHTKFKNDGIDWRKRRKDWKEITISKMLG